MYSLTTCGVAALGRRLSLQVITATTMVVKHRKDTDAISNANEDLSLATGADPGHL